MADICYDVDAALTAVPVNILPLTDDTDFKTREVAVAYNATGMDLVWNFVTTAGAYTQTAVTPTEAGDYDWAHKGDGMYSIEIPASGGASINNDTEGFGWFIGVATGVLPWHSPVFGFRAAAINDALIDGGDTLDVNTTAISGDSTAANNLKLSTLSIVTGTVSNANATPTTTVFAASDITEATADHYIGRVVIFTSGALIRQAAPISDYALTTGEGTFTVQALTEAPANGDTFIIV